MTPEEQVRQFAADFRMLREEIGKVIVGNKEIIDGVLITLFAGGNCLLEGVPGLGKTLLIRTLSQALDLKFSRIQFTPDLMPSDIVGTNLLVEDEHTGRKRFEFQQGPIFANIVLADEINRATPKTQSAMLEAMQERHVTSFGETRQLDKPFFVLATQNPLEQEGTYPLPEAQLDRFFFKLLLPYSTRDEMNEVLARTTRADQPVVKPIMNGEKITSCQRLVREIVIAPHVMDFATRLVLATHAGTATATPLVARYLRFGSSPRGAQTLVLAAKVLAMLDNRLNVAFVDIEQALLPALRHRIILNFEGEAEGISPDDILKDALANTPREG
ncbi:MAG: AAA family ATPase [Planctomycetota bacterium]